MIKTIIKGFIVVVFAIVAGVSINSIYYSGYNQGFADARQKAQIELDKILTSNLIQVSSEEKSVSFTPPPASAAPVQVSQPSAPVWSGPELWVAVNEKRLGLGVNPLVSQGELCTIASIRLNELLELGKLDGHEGFSNLPERRADLLWIFEKYNISEFLVSGAQSADGAVALWENTLGHKKLLTGGEYVWGCTYAQNGFGVAIAAF